MPQRLRSQRLTVRHIDGYVFALICVVRFFRLSRQRRGQAEVIGVEMGDDDGRDRARSARQAGQRVAPMLARGRVAKSGVDDDAPGAVVQQPQVDVIQREWQRHAQPVHAGGHGLEAGRRGRGVERVTEWHG